MKAGGGGADLSQVGKGPKEAHQDHSDSELSQVLPKVRHYSPLSLVVPSKVGVHSLCISV